MSLFRAVNLVNFRDGVFYLLVKLLIILTRYCLAERYSFCFELCRHLSSQHSATLSVWPGR